MVKKVLKCVLSLAMIFCTLTIASTNVNAVEKDYEIYPKPHSITYQDGEYIIRSDVNIVYDGTIDVATKNRLSQILKSKNKNVSISDKKVETKTNIFVGTYNSGGNASEYAKNNYSLDTSLINKFAGHQVFSNSGEIVVIGNDSDSAFFGITSLMHIFNQIEGSTLRNFTIKDYADTRTRGFIEGYYGIPWSNDDRMSLMKFGGDFKMNAYFFAPKDDPYHSGRWRDPYPADKLAEIKEMAAVGEASKCRFVWTIHPFMNGGVTESTYDADIIKIIEKFEQLYAAGVRQFGVLGDDAGALPRAVVVRAMNDLQDWVDKKGDVRQLTFCPAGYNAGWWNEGELDLYDAEFNPDVDIFWTGQGVCGDVSQDTLNHFKTYKLPEGNNPRRDPLFWLNWPVNDINGQRLMMGKGALLKTNINVNDISGVVSNPMQEAEASKTALFAISDYAWNIKKFDDDKSWADSFKYIDEDAGEYLHTLAKHISNPQPNGHGLVCPESEEIKPLVDEFKNALSSKNTASIKEKGTQLIKEMEIIIEACDGFRRDSKNENLKKEMNPFIGSLRDLCSSIMNFTKAAIALGDNDSINAVNGFTNGTADYNKSKKHQRALINGTALVSPGSTELIPLANAIQKAIADDINKIVSGEQEVLKITASSNMNSWYNGTKIESIVDGDLNTFAWNGAYEGVGQYFQIDLSTPTTIYGIQIANGKSNDATETFGKAKLKYSTDNGATWMLLNNDEYGNYATEINVDGIRLDNVTNVRYECSEAGAGRKWPAMREFKVLTEPADGPKFTAEMLTSPDGWSKPSDAEAKNMIDGDDSTYYHYTVRQGGNPSNTTIPGDYIGIKLSQSITLGKIRILQGNHASHGDYFENVDLEYSMNGTDWTKIDTFVDKREIIIDVSDRDITAQYVRLKNNVEQGTWIGMREFQVESKVFFNRTAYTNVDEYKTIKVNCLEDTNYMESTASITLEKNKYIGLKLKRVHEIKEIITDITGSNLTLEISKNGYEWKTVSAGNVTDEASYVRLINKTNSNITFDINSFIVNTNEIEAKKLYSASGFGADNPLNVFDNDWTTQTIYSGSQNQGRNFVYDLGQTIDLEKFKAVCRDSEGDYPRHGKFSVSEDGQSWTDILTLGNQDSDNPGEAAGTDNINDVLPVHEISYNTKEATNINKKVRYIKFEITRTKSGPDKWVRFQEFVINGGEHLSTENNPTLKSTSKETSEGLLKNMLDGNLSTMFIPVDKTGSFTYTITENNETVNTVKIIQDSNNISNAVVSARILNTTTRSTETWVPLGTLSQTINEFVLPESSTILDVKVEWKDTGLGISQFQVNKVANTAVDKTTLNQLLTSLEDTTTWTIDSKRMYNQAIEAGKEVNTASVTQPTINSAITMISNAITNKAIKGNITSLQNAVDNAITASSKYTALTWKVYSKAIENAKAGIANKDNMTQGQMNTMETAIETAQGQLVFNPTNKELAVLATTDIQMFINSISKPENIYTVNSFKALIDAKTELDDLIIDDKTSAQDPDKFAVATTKVNTAKTSLVGVGNIPALVTEFATVTESLYTKESYKVYKDAIERAKALLINGTADQIAAIETEVTNAKSGLVLIIIDKDTIKSLIKDLEKLSQDNYTTKSFKALADTIATVKDKVDTATNSELETYKTQLETAKNNLVSIVALKTKVNQAKALDENKYTTSSYVVLKAELEKAEKLYADGTKEQVSKAVTQLDKTIKALKVRVNEIEVKNYISSLVKVDGTAYTKESYERYSKAFDSLKAMLNDLANTSVDEFVKVQDEFNQAFGALQLKSDIPGDSVTTGDSTNIGLFIIPGILALAAIYLLRKKAQKTED